MADAALPRRNGLMLALAIFIVDQLVKYLVTGPIGRAA